MQFNRHFRVLQFFEKFEKLKNSDFLHTSKFSGRPLLAFLALLTIVFTISCSNKLSEQDICDKFEKNITAAKNAFPANDRESAITHLYENIKLATEHPSIIDSKSIAITYLLIGNIYNDLQDVESALKWYESAQKFIADTPDSTYFEQIIFNLAIANIRIDNTQKAKQYISQLRTKRTNKFNALLNFRIEFSEGLLQKSFSNNSNAIHHFNKALSIANNNSFNDNCKIDPMLESARYYLETDSTEKAIHLLSKYRYTLKNTDIYRKAKYLRTFMECYSKLNKRDSALVYQSQYFLLHDSIRRAESYKILSEHIERLNAEEFLAKERVTKKNSSIIQCLLIISLSALSLLATFFMYNIYSHKRTSKNLLASDYAMMRLQKQSGNTSETNPHKYSEPITAATNHTGKSLRDGLFEKARDIVERPENFKDPDFSLTRLADSVGINVK